MLAVGGLLAGTAAVRPGRSAAAPPRGAVALRELLSRLPHQCLLPTDFSPAAMRLPLLVDPKPELERLRLESSRRADHEEAPLRLATWFDLLELPEAPEQWVLALERAEARLRAGVREPRLVENRVAALTGNGELDQAVTEGEAAVKLLQRSSRARVLLGDALMARAVDRMARAEPAERRIATTSTRREVARAGDLYGEAVKLAPAEAEPRAARIGWRILKSRLTFLDDSANSWMAEVVREFREWAERVPGSDAPAWHLGHLAATHPVSWQRLPAEVRAIGAELLSLSGQGPSPTSSTTFRSEAEGLLAAARGDRGGAIPAFAAAAKSGPRPFNHQWSCWSQAESRLEALDGPLPPAQQGLLRGLRVVETDPPAAIALWQQALNLDPEDRSLRFNLGLALLRRNLDSREGLSHLLALVDLECDDPLGDLGGALGLLLAGRRDQAVEILRRLEASEGLPNTLPALIHSVLLAFG